MVEAGIDLSTVQEVLGHSSIRITERYRHIRDEYKRDQMAKLSLNEQHTGEGDEETQAG